MLSVAVTGATGFIGGVVISNLTSQGAKVRALVRNPDAFDAPEGVNVIKGSLSDTESLQTLARDVDVVINLAGVTHGRDDRVFFAANADGARAAASAAANAGARFVQVSSLAAREPSLSSYAQSKADGEVAVRSILSQNQARIVRLPAIYGPGDHAALSYFEIAKRGFAPEPRTKHPARATLLHVDDAAAAVTLAATTPFAEAPSENAAPIYEIPDDHPGGRTWREIGETLGAAMGRTLNPIRVPSSIIGPLWAIIDAADRIQGRDPRFRPGQAREFFHEDWGVANDNFSTATGWRPRRMLEDGFRETILWYERNGML